MSGTGYQSDGSYLPCPECLWAPAPVDPHIRVGVRGHLCGGGGADERRGLRFSVCSA